MQPDLTNPGIWIAASTAAAVLASNAAWVTRLLLRGRGVTDDRREVIALVGWLIGALFFALPPIFAWRNGALSPYLMGLGEVDWTRSLASGLFLALMAAGALFAAWIMGTRRPRPLHAEHAQERDGTSAWLAPLDAALLQWHWAFYRAGVAGWLIVRRDALAVVDEPLVRPLMSAAGADPFYWGCWLGMAVIALEWALNPFGRAALQDSRRRPYVLLRMALAVASTAVFVATRNLWLALLVHVSVETAAAMWPPLVKSPSLDVGVSEKRSPG